MSLAIIVNDDTLGISSARGDDRFERTAHL